MKTKIAYSVLALLSLTPGYSKVPERWLCVNAKSVSGLYSLEAVGTTSIDGQLWRSLDVYLIRDKNQDIDGFETYSYQPALTEVEANSSRVIIEGKNRKIFGKVTSSLSIELARPVRGKIHSRILEMATGKGPTSTAVYEGSLMLDVGSLSDANEIQMNCVAMPSGN